MNIHMRDLGRRPQQGINWYTLLAANEHGPFSPSRSLMTQVQLIAITSFNPYAAAG